MADVSYRCLTRRDFGPLFTLTSDLGNSLSTN